MVIKPMKSFGEIEEELAKKNQNQFLDSHHLQNLKEGQLEF